MVSKSRKCKECKRVFAKAESFRIHKLVTGRCRTEDELAAAGYTLTKTGWLHSMPKK
jgi:hypothetical protein